MGSLLMNGKSVDVSVLIEMGVVVVFVCGLSTVVILTLFEWQGEKYIHVKVEEKSDLAGS